MTFEILLSTYNGERYLSPLLDSILGQTHSDFHLTVRDDGSSDDTMSILHQYSNAHPERITVLHDGKNLRYPDCFWELLRQAPKADMYAYCDQDDVWDAEKLASCEALCSDKPMEEPLLYVHDYRICDADLNVTGEYHMLSHGYDPSNPCNQIYYVMTQGFTMILNEALRQRILQDPVDGKGIAHDRWTFWCGFFAGEIVHDPSLLAYYRRHGESVTQTGKGVSIVLKEWWHEDIRGSRLKDWSRIARYFAECYKEEMDHMDPSLREKWLRVAGAGRGFSAYFCRLFDTKRLKPSLSGELALRGCFLLNKK